MGIKFDEKTNSYAITYHRRHPVTRASKSIRRQGIKTKAEAEKIYKQHVSGKPLEGLELYWMGKYSIT